MTTLENDLVDLIAATNFEPELGLAVVCAAPGNCTVRVPLLRKHERPGGIMSGYILVAAADVAAWLAIKTLLGLEDASVTTDLHSAFIRAARGAVTCRAEVLRCGTRLVSIAAACFDDRMRIVSQHMLTYARAR